MMVIELFPGEVRLIQYVPHRQCAGDRSGGPASRFGVGAVAARGKHDEPETVEDATVQNLAGIVGA
ncbi:hypothetical protein MAUB1S_00764 [Mycolicibacterium aubagnense]